MKKYLGILAMTVLVATVGAFLGMHSIEFFTSTFSADNSSMGILGYMLTGGGLFLWMAVFMWKAKTQLEKVVSLVMTVICLIGELGTALFNAYMHTMTDAGFALSAADIKGVYLLVTVLAIAHGVSLVLELAGEQIIQAFQDDDGDGKPNIIDRHDNRKQNGQQNNGQHFQRPQNNNPVLAKASETDGAKLVDPTNQPPTQ